MPNLERTGPDSSGASGSVLDKSSSLRGVLIASSLGTWLEWFDFGLYGAVSALVFPELFFPALDPAAGVLASLATFGAGLALRPVGAGVFGRIGDRAGRKRAMVLAIFMMAGASLGIAVLPGYTAIGIWAPVLLLAFRCLQGFSLGGESTAALLMAMEHAPDRRRAFYGALVSVGAPAGLAFVTLVLVLVRFWAGEEGFLEWAWRVPFGLGFLVAVVGFLVRRYVDETPMFREARRRRPPLRRPMSTMLRLYPRTVVRLTLLWVANVAVSYIVNTYSIQYVTHDLGMPTETGLSLVFWATLLGVVATPLGGLVADRIGRKPVLFIGTCASLAGIVAYFPLLDSRMYSLMILAMAFTLNGQAFAFGALGAVLAEQFPTPLRYSGHAATYAMTNLLGGAATPFVAAFLVQTTGTTWSITGVLVAAYGLSLFMIHRTPETRGLDFRA